MKTPKAPMTYPVIDIPKTGSFIADISRQYGYTVKDIQSYLGLTSKQSVYNWFNGLGLPSIDNLYALSVLFDVAIDDILFQANDDCKPETEEPDFANPPVLVSILRCGRVRIF